MDERAEVVDLEQAVEQVARVAALDIAKSSAMVCTWLPSEANPERRVQRTWPVRATMDAINELADHLVCQGVELVVMEATGDFWRPFFYVLEDRGLRCWLVNARDVRNVPGRPKTDKLDAIWLAKLAERGMLRASFVPPAPIRALRDLTRLRATLVRDRARYRNRIQDVLEDACIKVSDKKDGASNLFGVSGRAMLDALVSGERNPRALAELARGQMRAKIPFLEKAFAGRFEDRHGYEIGMLLELHDGLTRRIEELTGKIEAAIAAVGAGRTKTFLGSRYRRIVKHTPKKKAVVAISRNILEIFWILIDDPDARFCDLGVDWHDRHVNRTRKTRQAVRDLEHLGYTVTLATAALTPGRTTNPGQPGHFTMPSGTFIFR